MSRKVDGARVLIMRDRGWSWRQIAGYFAVSPDTARCSVDPEHKAKLKTMRKVSEQRHGKRVRKRGPLLDHSPHHMGGDMPSALFKVPDAVMAERDRVTLAPLTISQALLGDPPPGRSALDKRRPHVVVDNG